MLEIYCLASAGKLIVLSLTTLSRPPIAKLKGGARFIGDGFVIVVVSGGTDLGGCTAIVELG